MLIFYILFSLFLSFLINYYYIRKFNTTFFFYFLVVFAVFFLLFYFLAFPHREGITENFSDDSGGVIGSSYTEEEEEIMLKEEDENEEKEDDEEEEEEEKEKEDEMEEEEKEDEMEEEEELQNDLNSWDGLGNGWENGWGMSMMRSNEGCNSYGPLNIKNVNISYNGNNTINEMDDLEMKDEACKKKDKKKNRDTENQKYMSDNPSSRIYDQSDWIKSYTAWSDAPDYYIPRKTDEEEDGNDDENQDRENEIKRIKKRNLDNEIYASYKYNEKCSVCPLLAEQPWSVYQSGDKEPMGYNI